MNKPKKLAFHTRQVCQSLNLRDSSEKTFQILLDSLLNTHQEYKLEPIIRFKVELQQVLNEYITSIDDNKPQTVTPTPVLSLNQTLRNNYQNQASKRQRPIETENTNINNNNTTSDNDINITATSDVLPLPSTTLESQSTANNNKPTNKVKIKAKKPKQHDDNNNNSNNNNNNNDEVIYKCYPPLPHYYCLYCASTITSLILFNCTHTIYTTVYIYCFLACSDSFL